MRTNGTDAGHLVEFFLKPVEPKADSRVENPFRVESTPGSALDRRSVNRAETRVIETSRDGSTAASKGSSSLLPSLDVSPVEEERQLQAKLLKLDVEAAEAAYESTRKKADRLSTLFEKAGGAVPKSAVDESLAEVKQKEIQLERAKTVLSLFELQAKRERDQVERMDRARKSLINRGSRSRSSSADGEEDPASTDLDQSKNPEIDFIQRR